MVLWEPCLVGVWMLQGEAGLPGVARWRPQDVEGQWALVPEGAARWMAMALNCVEGRVELLV